MWIVTRWLFWKEVTIGPQWHGLSLRVDRTPGTPSCHSLLLLSVSASVLSASPSRGATDIRWLASGLQDGVTVLVQFDVADDGFRSTQRIRCSRSVGPFNANRIRLVFRQFHCCGECFPGDCLGVGPTFGRNFRHSVDPQVIPACLNFDIVDAVFHLALCAVDLFDVFGCVGQTVALGTNGGLHLVNFFLRVL